MKTENEATRVPTVNLSQPDSSIFRAVGSHLRAAPIFLFGDTISLVNAAGEITPMKAKRFAGWLNTRIAFARPTEDGRILERIGESLGVRIFESDEFRSQLHELKGLSQVRLPAWTGEGDKRTVELAEKGFNPATGLYTLDLVPYAEDMDAETAWRVLWEEGFEDFCFDLEEAEVKEKSRSFAVLVGAMLGFYCRALFPEGTPRPMIVLNATGPGSCKSLLARMILAPVHGLNGSHVLFDGTETGKELESLLDSAATARKPYLVLAPGNGLAVSADLDRRALVIDLSEPEEATFTKPIINAWLFSDVRRARYLAALWFLVRRWRDAGRPMMTEHVKPGFEDWTALIGGIVTSFGMPNPCTPRTSADSLNPS